MAVDSRYSRNRIYIDLKEQEIIKNIPILLAGNGIESVIAECALRLGFENMTIIDRDPIELSNLNRENYIMTDISSDKAKALQKRLLEINPNAKIKAHNGCITEENIHSFIENHKIAVNALDFTSDIPLLFDKICQEKGIPVLHPYNLGWGGLVTIISPDNLSLDSIKKENEKFNDLNIIEYVTSYLKFWQTPQKWIEEIIKQYKNENLPPPQLSVASWLVASMCTHLLFAIATGRKTKVFPEFYLSNIEMAN